MDVVQKKRKSGRATPLKKARVTPTTDSEGSGPLGQRAARRSTTSGRAPEPSGRYTPPKANYRVRPSRHRIIGWVGVAFGILIAVLNDAMFITEDVPLLPFGHSEFYLMLALLVAGSSTWFLGAFDRGTTIYD